MKRTTIVVAGFLSVLLIACGGSSDSDSDSSSASDSGSGATLTKAALIKQADALCQKANDDVTPLAADYTAALKERDYKKAGDVTADIAKVAEARTTGLEALEAPESDAEAVDQYARYSAQTEDLMNTMADALREKDSTTIADATSGINAIAVKARKTAQKLGFQKCGNGS